MKHRFTIEKVIQAFIFLYDFFCDFFPEIMKMVFCKEIRNSELETLL
jgi:hypothetical protein